MLLIIFFLILLQTVAPIETYTVYTSYQELIQQWKKVVPIRWQHEASEIALTQQACDGSNCEYYYFEYMDESLANNHAHNNTLLFVSGLHGGSLVGPQILLHSYGKLQAARIIYLPVANPSSFAAQTEPTIDPEFDFPSANNRDCYRTASTFIIDHIFRHYQIDLTIILGTAATGIVGFPWAADILTGGQGWVDQEDIYKDLSHMVTGFIGEQVQSGNLHKLQGLKNGSFVDWAYGATRYRESIAADCRTYKFVEYASGTMDGLVLKIDLGLKEGSNQKNILISQGINMLEQFCYVLNPKLKLEAKEKTAEISFYGCKNATIHSLNVKRVFQSKPGEALSQNLYEFQKEARVLGSLNGIKSMPFIIDLSKSTLTKTDVLQVTLSYSTDEDWQRKGSTIFAKKRQYSQSITLDLAHTNVSYSHEKATVTQPTTQIIETLPTVHPAWIITVFVILLLLAIIILSFRRREHTSSVFSHHREKFQLIEYHEQTDHQLSVQNIKDHPINKKNIQLTPTGQ